MTGKEAADLLMTELDRRDAEITRLTAEITHLIAELTEARKQPVRLLPEVTEKIAHEMCREYDKCDYHPNEIGRAYNTVLARHFCEAAEARVKPTLDVEAVVEAALQNWVKRETRRECAAKLRPWRELSQKMDAVLDAMERGE